METTNQKPKNQCARGRASGGSRLQVQIYANEFTDELNHAVLEALPSLAQENGKLRWMSPLTKDDYVEYRDEDFLRALGCEANAKYLKEFWPNGGPCWDALARLELEGNAELKGIVLVEAKSHRIEIFGNGCGASKESLQLIRKTLRDTRELIGVEEKNIEWRWLGPLYQYANRLAHLYFLPEVFTLPVWLVNIYFINDEDRPTSFSAWEEFLPEVKEELGLINLDVPDVADVFLEEKRGEI